MRITPRKEEVQQVIDILESDQYASGEAMAKALIKEIADMLDYRDWFALTHRFGEEGTPGGLNWGPFGTVGDAEKMATIVATGGRFGVVKLYSPGLLLAGIAGAGAKKGLKDFCTEPHCRHAAFVHSTAGSGRGKCGLSACACKQFKR